MMDEHEHCREEMKRINQEWSERYYKSCRVKAVVLDEGEQPSRKISKYLNITTIIQDIDGLVVMVK